MSSGHVDDKKNVHSTVNKGNGVVKIGIAAAQVGPKIPIDGCQHGSKAESYERYWQHPNIYIREIVNELSIPKVPQGRFYEG